jgi:hypothetical protein
MGWGRRCGTAQRPNRNPSCNRKRPTAPCARTTARHRCRPALPSQGIATPPPRGRQPGPRHSPAYQQIDYPLVRSRRFHSVPCRFDRFRVVMGGRVNGWLSPYGGTARDDRPRRVRPGLGLGGCSMFARRPGPGTATHHPKNTTGHPRQNRECPGQTGCAVRDLNPEPAD